MNHRVWLDAYLEQLGAYKTMLSSHKIKSIFFGGGTPSLMEANMVSEVLNYINKISSIADTEITLEANPTSFETAKFKDFKSAGVNRVSLGVQSFQESALQFLGRNHSSLDAKNAIYEIAQIFDSFSFDLIYALPQQTIASWTEELKYALGLARDHISLYQLTIEKGTAFYAQHKNKEFKIPSQELSSDLYDLTTQKLLERGLKRYEISNYASLGNECKHNLSYWNYDQYLGIGPGAHSRIWIDGVFYAITMTHNPENWLNKPIQEQKPISVNEASLEFILVGLRLESGISLSSFERKFGVNLSTKLNMDKINFLRKKNLLTIDEDNIKLTDNGRFLLHSIVAEITV